MVAGVTSSMIKSGTNQFHGDFLYIPQNEKWRAEYEELDIPRDDDIKDSFETSLGGPIVRDKAWFFASYGKINTNEGDLLANGDHVDVGFDTEAKILKLNFQPSSQAPAPAHRRRRADGQDPDPADRRRPVHALRLRAWTRTWRRSPGRSPSPTRHFLETKVATQEDALDRDALVSARHHPGSEPGVAARQQLPVPGPGQRPALQRRSRRAPGSARSTPRRKQANASLSLFRGAHEIKFGADYQDVSQETFNIIGVAVPRRAATTRTSPAGSSGRRTSGCSIPPRRSRPPRRCCRPTRRTASTSPTASTSTSACAWTIRPSTNDAGTEVNSSTDFAPRLGGDLRPRRRGHDAAQGDRRPLLPGDRAGHLQPRVRHQAERHQPVHPVPLEHGRRGATTSVSSARCRCSGFNPVLVRSLLQGRGEPRASSGSSCRRGRSRRAAAGGKIDDTFWTHRSVERRRPGGAATCATGTTASASTRRVQLQLNRAMRNNWTLRTNYTYGENNGNNFGSGDGTHRRGRPVRRPGRRRASAPASTDATTSATARAAATPTASTTSTSSASRCSRSATRNDIGLGGYFGFRSGEYWGRRPQHRGGAPGRPVTAPTINTTTYARPRDAQPDGRHLHAQPDRLLGVPDHGQRPGPAGRRGGERHQRAGSHQHQHHDRYCPTPGKVAYQAPREYRLQIGITF